MVLGNRTEKAEGVASEELLWAGGSSTQVKAGYLCPSQAMKGHSQRQPRPWGSLSCPGPERDVVTPTAMASQGRACSGSHASETSWIPGQGGLQALGVLGWILKTTTYIVRR